MFRAAAVLLSAFVLLTAADRARAGGVLVTPPVLAANATVSCLVTFLGDESTTATAAVHRLERCGGLGWRPERDRPKISTPAVRVGADGYSYCSFQGLTKGMRGYIALIVGGQTEWVLPAAR